jgi:hypothetical protein
MRLFAWSGFFHAQSVTWEGPTSPRFHPEEVDPMPTDAPPNPGQVVICNERNIRHGVHSTCAHHRDFPEIEAEGETPRRAAEQLSARLISALDNIGSDWHRAHITRAIADVQEFVKQEA